MNSICKLYYVTSCIECERCVPISRVYEPITLPSVLGFEVRGSTHRQLQRGVQSGGGDMDTRWWWRLRWCQGEAAKAPSTRAVGDSGGWGQRQEHRNEVVISYPVIGDDEIEWAAKGGWWRGAVMRAAGRCQWKCEGGGSGRGVTSQKFTFKNHSH